MNLIGVRRAWVGAAVVASGLAFAAAAGSAGAQAPYSAYGPSYGPSYGGFYIGASAGEALYNEDQVPQLSPTIVMFRFGQQFSPYLAIEGRVGTGVSGSSADGYHINLDALYGGYLKGMLPINRWLSPYAIAGVGGEAAHRNYPDYHSNDAGLSFGGGLELNVGGGASIDVEWVRLINNGDNFGYGFNTDLLTLGFDWHPYIF